ncbi:MAG: hypothetical protein MJ072_07035 [Clostridia bacterium]|nr:hypothetical protein [Clostridia bacterium]
MMNSKETETKVKTVNEDSAIHAQHRDRLRSKLLSAPQSLNKHELMEVLLFYAIPRMNVNPLAHRLMYKFGSIDEVLHADESALMEVRGVGASTATYLRCLGKILDHKADADDEITSVQSANEAKDYFSVAFKDTDVENFCAVFMDQEGKIIDKTLYTDGSTNQIRVLMKNFIKSIEKINPYSVVVSHNHPSGNPVPSYADDVTTIRLSGLFHHYNVKFYDHVITGKKKFYSYRNDNRIPEYFDH